MSVKGAVHSIETFGSVDGPGVRFVIFLKAVPCAANIAIIRIPGNAGSRIQTVSIAEKRAMRYRSYWGKNGGITVSGGEPLLQIDFLLDLFQRLKRGKHSHRSGYGGKSVYQ